jgi:hypothetical protein
LSKLHVYNGINANSSGQPGDIFLATIYQADNTPSKGGLLVKNNWATETTAIIDFGNDFVGGPYASYYRISGVGTHVFGGNTNGARTENMRITTNGNVGIGTTIPLAKLHVEGYIFSRNSYKSNVFYFPPDWSYSTTTTGSWVQLWSFTYTAPVEGYATISVAGHWSHGTNGAAPFLSPMVNGSSIHQSGLFDAYTLGAAQNYGGTPHQYYYNTSPWWGFSHTVNVKLSAATHTIGMGVYFTTAGTLSVNGAGITLKFSPKFLT